MSMKKKCEFYYIFLIIISLTIIKCEENCQSIKCSSFPDINVCISVESKISLFQKCPNGKICDKISDDPVNNAKCVEKELNFKRLPSLPCTSNEDCITDICEDNMCIGKDLEDRCESVSHCGYGYTCRKDPYENLKKCLLPVSEGGECLVDTDCTINCGCMNKKCVKYFSLDNYEQTDGLDYNSDFSFCKSGYTSPEGICMNISLPQEITECSETKPCEYNQGFETLTLPSNCLCGYNPDGKRFCLLGSGNRNYTKYLEQLKNYHLNNENCHLSERTASGCQKDLLSGSQEILLKIHKLINAKYWAKSNNKLINASECVFDVELPDYNRTLDQVPDPEPIEEGKCAIYSCKNSIDGGICASSKYTDPFDIKIDLADVCSDDVLCKINGDPNYVFYNKTDVNATCSSLILNKRYPGEKCEIDSECVYPLGNPSSQFHKCEDGICNGMEKDGICEDNSWCVVGYFCDSHEGRCKKQLSKDEPCVDSKDCKNNLLCHNGKCSDKLFSLEDGFETPETEDIEFRKKFCKSGEMIHGICVSFNDIEKKLSNDEYRKCDYDSYCTYKINGLNILESIKYEKCPCGYNSEGQGYCPHYHDYSTNEWDEYKKLLKKIYDNKCHTENRFNCYINENNDEIKIYKNKLEKGHLFYKSDSCVNRVLKDNFIKINNIISILGLVLVLI